MAAEAEECEASFSYISRAGKARIVDNAQDVVSLVCVMPAVLELAALSGRGGRHKHKTEIALCGKKSFYF